MFGNSVILHRFPDAIQTTFSMEKLENWQKNPTKKPTIMFTDWLV